jgi:nitrate/TMAO reductase-like tetraheme cytochrome c subunit
MKTNTVGAFHKNATATAGTCIDCHKTQNAAGKKAPTKCVECHKKENV